MIPLLTIDPARMGGAITIRGTRGTLSAVRRALSTPLVGGVDSTPVREALATLDNFEVTEIAAWHPLWPGRVEAVWGAPGDESSPWRYLLTCTWEPARPQLVVVGLNPSTASPATGPDATCQRWLSMAIRWGFGGLQVANLFGLRATSPKDLAADTFRIAGHEPRVVNNRDDPDWRRLIARTDEVIAEAPLVLCCWGPGGRIYGKRIFGGDPTPLKVGHDDAISPGAAYLHATADGYPIHPLARLPGVLVSELRPRFWITGELVNLPIDEVL